LGKEILNQDRAEGGGPRPNGPGIELPAAREGTTAHPAGARRVHPEPGGRRLEALAGRPSGGRTV